MPYLALVLALVVGGVVSPVPEEATLASAGAAIHVGWLSAVPTVIASVIGVMLGDVALYVLGWASLRGVRVFFFVRAGPGTRMRERATRLLDRWSNAAIIIARFVPGLRGAVFFVAGASGVSPRRVVLVDLAASLVHVPLLLMIGASLR